jgi:hypothetical protein
MTRKIGIFILHLFLMLAKTWAAERFPADDSTEKNECSKPPPISKLLPISESAFYGSIVGTTGYPVLGAGRSNESLFAVGPLWKVEKVWGQPLHFGPGREGTVRAFSGTTPLTLSHHVKYIVLAIQNGDYSLYYKKSREPREYFPNDIVYAFPCGGIRPATDNDLKELPKFMKQIFP